MIWYGAFIILTEYSTPFVNNRWFIAVLQKNNPSWDISSVEIQNGLAIWFAFLVCRIFMLPFLLFSVFKNFEQVSKTHIGVWGLVIVGASVVTVLSYFWFYKITKGIVKKLSERKK